MAWQRPHRAEILNLGLRSQKALGLEVKRAPHPKCCCTYAAWGHVLQHVERAANNTDHDMLYTEHTRNHAWVLLDFWLHSSGMLTLSSRTGIQVANTKLGHRGPQVVTFAAKIRKPKQPASEEVPLHEDEVLQFWAYVTQCHGLAKQGYGQTLRVRPQT